MIRKSLCAAVLAPLALSACKTAESGGSALRSAGDTVAGAASSIPSLVNVDLRNVLNDLSLDLNLDRANVPINAQIPITLAANICGVSINILSASTGGQANCTANTTSPELAQVVQQQIAAGGSVGGGAQGGSTAGTSSTTTSSPSTGSTGSTTSSSTGTGGSTTGTATGTSTSGSATPTQR